MNRDDFREILEKNWYLLAAAVVLVIVAGGVWLRPGEEAPTGPAGANQTPANSAASPEAIARETAARQEVLGDTTQNEIDKHMATIEANPESPETPAVLLAVATMYKTEKRDYAQAAVYYERIVREHPTWDMIGKVFPDLEVCLKEIGNTTDLKWLYNEWMKRMPSDSQEYLYAQKALSELP